MKKLRLLFTKFCDRKCPGCCNKGWDLDNLETVTHYNYDEILITGGEPLLYPHSIIRLVQKIRASSQARIYIYTAMVKNPSIFLALLDRVDGITLTLHTKKDIDDFSKLNDLLALFRVKHEFEKSLRLNVFKGVLNYNQLLNLPKYWKVKKDMVWIKDCPLPKDEEFKRI